MPSRVFSERPTRILRRAWDARQIAVDADAWSGKGAAGGVNEDSFVCASVARRLRGAGSPLLLAVAEGNEHASSVATRSLAESLSRMAAVRIDRDPDAVLREALLGAEGTRVTAALVLWPRVHLVHAGGGRAYHVRRGTLHRLPIDAATAPLEPGDGVLLVTDGVSDSLGRDELAEIASRPCSAHAVCHMLVEAARARGTRSDATAAFVRFGLPV